MAKYEEFLAQVDTSQAGTDEYGDLAWHIACSVEANREPDFTDESDLSCAKMILDDWRSFYPQLVR